MRQQILDMVVCSKSFISVCIYNATSYLGVYLQIYSSSCCHQFLLYCNNLLDISALEIPASVNVKRISVEDIYAWQ